MKNSVAVILLIFATSLTLVSCKGNQNQGNSTDNDKGSFSCEMEAKVMDFTGLSSCSILLELADGSFLDPIRGLPKAEIMEAETVRISYTNVPDAMSSCMKGKLVNITCFEIIRKGIPAKGKID